MKFFEECPRELKLKILSNLSAKDIQFTSVVSKEFMELSKNNVFSYFEKLNSKFIRQLNSALSVYNNEEKLFIDLFSVQEVEDKAKTGAKYFKEGEAIAVVQNFIDELQKLIPDISVTFYRHEADKRVDLLPFPTRYQISLPSEEAKELQDKVGYYSANTEECFLKR